MGLQRPLRAIVGGAAERPGSIAFGDQARYAVLALRVTIPTASALRAVTPLHATTLGTPVTDGYHRLMDLDSIDEAVLALLYLGIHRRHRAIPGARAWKSHDWDALDRLHVRGLISDPATKAKSVLLTEDGLREAEAAFRRLFDPQD